MDPQLNYQERVKAELAELSERVDKLDKFIRGNPLFHGLPEDEQTRLNRQLEAMWTYQGILAERIEHFPALEKAAS